MSKLIYSRSAGELSLVDGGGAGPKIPAARVWTAHNRVAKSAKGLFPIGTWRWSHYNAHVEGGQLPGCHSGAYGCFGIHVFTVPGRPGLGVHAGRTKGAPDVVGGVTMGCIRVPPNAMEIINQVHAVDPLTTITVME